MRKLRQQVQFQEFDKGREERAVTGKGSLAQRRHSINITVHKNV